MTVLLSTLSIDLSMLRSATGGVTVALSLLAVLSFSNPSTEAVLARVVVVALVVPRTYRVVFAAAASTLLFVQVNTPFVMLTPANVEVNVLLSKLNSSAVRFRPDRLSVTVNPEELGPVPDVSLLVTFSA